MLGHALLAADVKPATIRPEAFGSDDAVGPLTDIPIRIARIEDLEAGLAVGAGSRDGARPQLAIATW